MKAKTYTIHNHRFEYIKPILPYTDSKFIPSGEMIPKLTSKKRKKSKH